MYIFLVNLIYCIFKTNFNFFIFVTINSVYVIYPLISVRLINFFAIFNRYQKLFNVGFKTFFISYIKLQIIKILNLTKTAVYLLSCIVLSASDDSGQNICGDNAPFSSSQVSLLNHPCVDFEKANNKIVEGKLFFWSPAPYWGAKFSNFANGLVAYYYLNPKMFIFTFVIPLIILIIVLFLIFRDMYNRFCWYAFNLEFQFREDFSKQLNEKLTSDSRFNLVQISIENEHILRTMNIDLYCYKAEKYFNRYIEIMSIEEMRYYLNNEINYFDKNTLYGLTENCNILSTIIVYLFHYTKKFIKYAASFIFNR